MRAADGAKLQDLFYFYDPVGNITTIRDDAHQTVFFAGQQVTPTQEFEYDALYRLISATGREHAGGVGDVQRDQNDLPLWNLPHPNDAQAIREYTETYAYDGVGNILEMFHDAGSGSPGTWRRRYAYGQNPFGPGAAAVAVSNRLHSTSLPGDAEAGPYTAGYTHDANGNMVAMPHLSEMLYTHADQMKRADLGGGGTAYYTYDASGERVRKVIQRLGTTREERIYLGGWELYRKRQGAGAEIVLERETLHVMDDARRIAMVETKTVDADVQGALAIVPRVRFQYGNHLDSAHLECDEAGLVISYEEYHPYGTPAYRSARSGVEVSEKRYRYTGKERDDETGFQYHSARYLAPWLGRWTSADPVGMVDGTLHYAYALNNPVAIRDPLGTWGEAFLAKARAAQNALVRAKDAVLDTAAEGGSIVAGVFVESVSRHPVVVVAKEAVGIYEGAKESVETGDLRPLVRATPPGKVVEGVKKVADVAKKEGVGGLVALVLPITQLKPEVEKAKQAWAAGDHYGAARHGTKAGQAIGDTLMLLYGGGRTLQSLAGKGRKLLETTGKALVAEAPEASAGRIPAKVSAAEASESTTGTGRGTAAMSSGGEARGGGKTGRKVNVDRLQSAQENIESLKAELQKLKTTPNKTPEIKEQIERLEKALSKEIGRTKKSESHAQKGQGYR